MRLLSRYPWAVLATSGLLSLLSILCSLTLHTLPDFTDPQEVSTVHFGAVHTVSSILYSTHFTNIEESDYRLHLTSVTDLIKVSTS